MVNHRRQVLARMGVEVWYRNRQISCHGTLQGDDVQAFDATEIGSGLGEEARVGIEDSSDLRYRRANGEHQAPVSPAYDQPFDTELILSQHNPIRRNANQETGFPIIDDSPTNKHRHYRPISPKRNRPQLNQNLLRLKPPFKKGCRLGW